MFELDRKNFGRDSDANGAAEQPTIAEIRSTIAESPSPMVVSLKGEQGVLLAVVPLLKCAKEVDFVIIAGDLFNTAIPRIDAVKFATEQLKRLQEANIPSGRNS